ncbi:MAG: GH32 C-terminal domain-containing protein, partial [Lachnospiraceae bacterium]|nr:GH32 C-terminal domain-containing protein [Lachnospiraceae bacterium]
LKLAAKGDLYTEVDYDFRTGTLIFDRTHSGTGRDCAHMRRVKTENADGHLRLRILMDLYSVEMFVNDGEMALTSVIRTPMECDQIRMQAVGKVKANIKKYDINVR